MSDDSDDWMRKVTVWPSVQKYLEGAVIRDALVYITEQRMLPYSKRECIMCAGRGSGCFYCSQTGKLSECLTKEHYERVMKEWERLRKENKGLEEIQWAPKNNKL